MTIHWRDAQGNWHTVRMADEARLKAISACIKQLTIDVHSSARS